jgi:hypothetical protein
VVSASPTCFAAGAAPGPISETARAGATDTIMAAAAATPSERISPRRTLLIDVICNTSLDHCNA